jgi:succinate dehydrogenase/fumarate reductase cytochrome b subunit
MLVKILGIIDLSAAVSMLMLHHGVGGWRMCLGFAVYLLAKGYAFRSSWASYIDMLAGVYMLISIFSTNAFLSYAFAIFLAQKAMRSIF